MFVPDISFSSYILMLIKETRRLIRPLITWLRPIPFFIDGQDEPFWFSFAVGSSGGLLFSILAIIFVMPALMRKIE